jgi:ribosome-associated protein
MKKKEENKILRVIGQAIVDKKGLNLLTLDVRGISSMTDYFVIAEGTVDRHVVSLAKNVEDAMKQEGFSPCHVEGIREGEWVVLDYMDVVIHLFIPDLRQHYALEEAWKEGKIVDVPVDYESPPVQKGRSSRTKK